MSLLTYRDLKLLVALDVVQNVHPTQINGASIDLTLGNTIWVEEPIRGGAIVVDLHAKEVPNMVPVDLLKTGYFDLNPGQFCLAATEQVFNLPPDIAGEYKLKSSLARAGLNHALAGWCDPSWHGSVLTLEFTNTLEYHKLRLRAGMKCGQIVLWRGPPVPDHASYAAKGQYNQDTTATPSKGVR